MMTKDKMKELNIDSLYVAEAVHKTHIDLNEKGTKAAAVTYFGVYKNTSVAEPRQPKIINVELNKSFIYMIRDKESKEILFIGVVDKPNEWKASTCDNL
jgi:serpin B